MVSSEARGLELDKASCTRECEQAWRVLTTGPWLPEDKVSPCWHCGPFGPDNPCADYPAAAGVDQPACLHSPEHQQEPRPSCNN